MKRKLYDATSTLALMQIPPPNLRTELKAKTRTLAIGFHSNIIAISRFSVTIYNITLSAGTNLETKIRAERWTLRVRRARAIKTQYWNVSLIVYHPFLIIFLQTLRLIIFLLHVTFIPAIAIIFLTYDVKW